MVNSSHFHFTNPHQSNTDSLQFLVLFLFGLDFWTVSRQTDAISTLSTLKSTHELHWLTPPTSCFPTRICQMQYSSIPCTFSIWDENPDIHQTN